MFFVFCLLLNWILSIDLSSRKLLLSFSLFFSRSLSLSLSLSLSVPPKTNNKRSKNATPDPSNRMGGRQPTNKDNWDGSIKRVVHSTLSSTFTVLQTEKRNTKEVGSVIEQRLVSRNNCSQKKKVQHHNKNNKKGGWSIGVFVRSST